MSLYDKTKAILIAIDNYPGNSGIPKLSYCVKDSNGLKEILQNEYKFNEVITLYNEKATKQGIIDRILKTELGQNDALLIFYAGHGYTETTKKGDKIGYIVPYDGSISESELQKNLDMGYILDYISKKNKRKTYFLYI